MWNSVVCVSVVENKIAHHTDVYIINYWKLYKIETEDLTLEFASKNILAIFIVGKWSALEWGWVSANIREQTVIMVQNKFENNSSIDTPAKTGLKKGKNMFNQHFLQ